MLGPLLAFTIVWTLAWRRYNQPDGTIADLVLWLSVGALVYACGAWLFLQMA